MRYYTITMISTFLLCIVMYFVARFSGNDFDSMRWLLWANIALASYGITFFAWVLKSLLHAIELLVDQSKDGEP